MHGKATRRSSWASLAVDSLEVLQTVGPARWRRPTGKHDPMHVEQLLDLGVLAELASELQPMDCAVPLYSFGRIEEYGSCNGGGVHLCGAVARPVVQATDLGMAGQPVCIARSDCEKSVQQIMLSVEAVVSTLGGARRDPQCDDHDERQPGGLLHRLGWRQADVARAAGLVVGIARLVCYPLCGLLRGPSDD